jgi:alpha-L-glutamate ligase-like protein
MGYRDVLGLNFRELALISRLNPPARILEIAGSKLNTKRLLAARGIPVPATYAVIETRRDVARLDWGALPDEFALKPSGGGRGCGIAVAAGRLDPDSWRDVGGVRVTREALRYHVLAILAGDFSREGRCDIAYFEQRIRTSTDLTGHAPTGLPDVRVIVCEGRPLMAMTRLPTLESGGRANLHQGAVGVGIDVETGSTLSAVRHGRTCTRHPDTGAELIGRRVPCWEEIVALAVAAARLSGLGYTGVDLVVDDHCGPAVLEVNARPGLDIQIANARGLRARLGPPAEPPARTARDASGSVRAR